MVNQLRWDDALIHSNGKCFGGFHMQKLNNKISYTHCTHGCTCTRWISWEGEKKDFSSKSILSSVNSMIICGALQLKLWGERSVQTFIPPRSVSVNCEIISRCTQHIFAESVATLIEKSSSISWHITLLLFCLTVARLF